MTPKEQINKVWKLKVDSSGHPSRPLTKEQLLKIDIGYCVTQIETAQSELSSMGRTMYLGREYRDGLKTLIDFYKRARIRAEKELEELNDV